MTFRAWPDVWWLIAGVIAATALLASCGPDAEPPAATGDVIPEAPAAIGRVHSLEGDVRIWTGARERRADVGATLEQADVVRVATGGWALLAMVDGATITLRPETELRLDEYRYDPDGDPQRNSAILSLVHGAFRSITGLIGQTNRSGYQVRTQTATIGIRGTDHEPAYYPPPPPGQKADREPGTYDKVNDGETVIRRPTGEVQVRRGQTAFAPAAAREPPRLLPRAPQFYERHAEVDRRAVQRRADFQQRFTQEHERKSIERRQQREAQKKADEERRRQEKDARKDERRERQDEKKAERDARKKEKDERRKDRDDRKQDKDDRKKDRDERRDAKKRDDDDRRKAQEKKREAAAEERQKGRQREQAERQQRQDKQDKQEKQDKQGERQRGRDKDRER